MFLYHAYAYSSGPAFRILKLDFPFLSGLPWLAGASGCGIALHGMASMCLEKMARYRDLMVYVE